MTRNPLVFSGSVSSTLTQKICTELNVELGQALVTRFSDGESRVKILENVRNRDCYVVQSTRGDEALMELLVMVDALKRASARSVAVVTPYFGYARQDRKAEPRTPVTAKLVANMITVAGASRVLAVDLHAGQIQGFFDIPVDNLMAAPVLAERLQQDGLHGPGVVVVSPDAGGVERARLLAKRLGCEIAMIDKRRPAPNVSEVMNLVGDVRGKQAVIVDDIVDTGGSVAKAAEALHKAGATRVYVCMTHAILSGNATTVIKKSGVDRVYHTDTLDSLLPNDPAANRKLYEVSVAPLLAEAIKRIHSGDSISSLFS